VEIPAPHRIMFPFVAGALSKPALDAALRLSIAEGATLVPVFLARVPLDLPLDAPLLRQSGICLPLQEAIEQRATEAGVPVDARIQRGRSYRHALRQAIQTERFDWIVIAAASNGHPGFDADDVAWVLDNAPGEIVVLRPAAEEHLAPHRSTAPSVVNMKRQSRDDPAPVPPGERRGGVGAPLSQRGTPTRITSASGFRRGRWRPGTGAPPWPGIAGRAGPPRSS
jgi:hypothetical protein